MGPELFSQVHPGAVPLLPLGPTANCRGRDSRETTEFGLAFDLQGCIEGIGEFFMVHGESGYSKLGNKSSQILPSIGVESSRGCCMPSSMGFYEDAREGIKRMARTQSDLSKATGISAGSISRFIGKNAVGTIKSDHLAKILEHLGVRLVFPDEFQTTKNVQFVSPRMVNVPPGSPPPSDDRWMAVQMVGMAGAGSGIFDPSDAGEYLMVLRDHPAVQRRSNLIGVKIHKHERSMLGTIDPEDIVVVDRDDIRHHHKSPGNIYLARDPDGDGEGCMVKRVVFETRKDQTNIIYYSDNTKEDYHPKTFDFKKVFDNDPGKALIGRVVVCFSDMTKK